MRRGLALIIRPGGVLERVPEAPVTSLDWLYSELASEGIAPHEKLAAGGLTVALTTAPAGRERIVVWCNDDFQRLQLPPNCMRATDGWLLQGNLVVTGCDREGENRGLTKSEEEGVVLLWGPGAKLPTLNLWHKDWGLQP